MRRSPKGLVQTDPKSGRTPLACAVAHQSLSTVRLFIKALEETGLDQCGALDARDNQDNTLAMLAIDGEGADAEEIVAALALAKAKATASASRPDAPFHAAANPGGASAASDWFADATEYAVRQYKAPALRQILKAYEILLRTVQTHIKPPDLGG